MTQEAKTQTVPTELTQQQAVSILIQAANFAQSKGVFSLDDAAIIAKAVKLFVPATDSAATATGTAPEPAG